MTFRVAARAARAGTHRRRCAPHHAVVAALLAACASPLRAQAVPAGFEQGIFELRVARIATETVPALLSSAGVVLVPIDRVVALTEVPARRSDSTFSVERARNGGWATLDLRGRRIVDASNALPLGAEELVRADGVYYLATARVGQLLGARVEADLGQLAVTMTRIPPFPVEQAAARAQRTAGGVTRRNANAVAPSTPFVPQSGGAVVDWMASTVGSAHAFGSSTGSLRSAMAVYGGDLTTGLSFAGDGTGGVRASSSELSYRRGIPGNAYVRQFQIGDILGGGSQLRSFRGVTLTNARLVTDPSFGSIPVDLSLPQGWQYEIYQDNQLIGFSDGGPRTPVYVPLRYGTTPVQVRLVSPTGDETVRDYSYLIPQTQQQPGRFEYTAGGGHCAYTCTALAFAQTSYGVTPWLSASLGAERTTIDSATHLRPEGGVSVLTYSGWNAQLQAAQASFTRASLLYAGSGPLIGSGAFSRTYLGADQPSVIATADQSRWLFDGQLQLRGAADHRVSGWRLDNTLEGIATGSPDRTRTALTAEHRTGSIGISYETDRTRALHESGVTMLTVLPASWHLSSALASVLFEPRSLHALELATSMQTGRRGAAAATLRWQRGSGMVLSLGFNGALGAMRLTSRLSASRTQPTYLASAASGSVALDGTHRPTVFEGPGVGLSGVAGRVFYDVNGDGRFDVGDLPASNVRVVVNGAQVRSDSMGTYHAWNVVPYEPSAIAIDTLAFTDFSWTLLRGRTSLRATPGIFNHIDFPLVRTRELAGQVVGDSAIATVGGVTLVLTSESGGAAQRIVTFSDGSFYVSRILPGRYRLTVAQSALDALHAVADPATMLVEVAIVADDPVLTLPPLRLRRRPDAGR
ncbi:MAG TPA: hypothetical protein VFI52_06055 [Gemmatimonadaceae bacterium]|nr:hypothetical protein [Gemmatimonadaceae bacterium]